MLWLSRRASDTFMSEFDDASWVWADASGQPIILMGLAPGPHKVLIELEDANHHTLDQGLVTFGVPEKNAAEKNH
jgi:hypothetical protein